MIEYLIVAAVAGVIGFLIAAIVKASVKETKSMTDYAIKRLKRHDIEVAISEDRYVDDPVETIKRVKNDFAREIVRIIDDLIDVEDSKRTGHFVFSVTIWTKEAADDREQNQDV